MTDYKLCCFDSHGNVSATGLIRANNDCEALRAATGTQAGGGRFELWDSDRMVGASRTPLPDRSKPF